jgi:GTP-binding protein
VNFGRAMSLSLRGARFVAGAAEPTRFPVPRAPEIAFAGRSNVGKSSLLNRLVGDRRLARVSKTPGRTQQINFFAVRDVLVLVDLPGYGFARVPLHVKQGWKVLVEAYLTTRPCLRLVVVLVDLRRGLGDEDAALLGFLQAHQVPALLAATKADKLPRGQRLQAAGALATSAADFDTPLVVSSAVTGEGMAELQQAILAAATLPPRRWRPVAC